jgi:DNA-damage-inducible protein D
MFVVVRAFATEGGAMAREENEHELSLFENMYQIRRVWHNGEWYYSIIDVIAILSESAEPRKYWDALKRRAKSEGFDETLAQAEQLKLKSVDGRFRLTDTANRQTLLRIIQSIPSPKAEPFRLWLAQVGEERFEEIEHPEAALDRVRATYRAKGYDEAWIEERIKNDLIRNELTDEWRDRGAREGTEFAILTNELSKGTFGLTVQAYKQYKVLPARTNLRDHMTPLELALCSLSEATSITLHQDRDSQGFPELKRDAVDAGNTAGQARQLVEKTIGKPVVSRENRLVQLERAHERRKEDQKRLPTKVEPSLFDSLSESEQSES